MFGITKNIQQIVVMSTVKHVIVVYDRQYRCGPKSLNDCKLIKCKHTSVQHNVLRLKQLSRKLNG